MILIETKQEVKFKHLGIGMIFTHAPSLNQDLAYIKVNSKQYVELDGSGQARDYPYDEWEVLPAFVVYNETYRDLIQHLEAGGFIVRYGEDGWKWQLPDYAKDALTSETFPSIHELLHNFVENAYKIKIVNGGTMYAWEPRMMRFMRRTSPLEIAAQGIRSMARRLEQVLPKADVEELVKPLKLKLQELGYGGSDELPGKQWSSQPATGGESGGVLHP